MLVRRLFRHLGVFVRRVALAAIPHCGGRRGRWGGRGETLQEPKACDRLLTEREREMLRLVAHDRSSKAIAQHLFLSPSTVNQHMTAVFNKLGVDTRAQTAAVAA